MTDALLDATATADPSAAPLDSPVTDSPAVEAVAPSPDGTASTATEVSPPAAPAEYHLTMPDGFTDDAVLQRTVAHAMALGLSESAAQAMLEARVEERRDQMAQYEATVEAWKPGGSEWAKREAEYRAAILADPEFGGSQDKLNLAAERAQLVLSTYGNDEVKAFLDETGLGSHPVALKFLAKLGAAMSESSTLPLGRQSKAPKTAADILYPTAPVGA